MLGIIDRAPPSSPLAAYATGILALLMRPQEYEVEAVRFVALTKIPETFLQRMSGVVQSLGGRAHPGPFPNGGNPIDMDMTPGLVPASVNDEIDNEEPPLAQLIVPKCKLHLYEFIWSLEVVAQVSQYVEVLTPVLQNGGIDLIHFLLTSNAPVLVSYALSCLASLLVHPKFASLFIARDGLLLLIAKPSAQHSDVAEYNKTMAVVIDNLLSVPNTVEQICLLTDQVQTQFLELIFWLTESAQEEALKTLCAALSRILVYEAFVDIFHRHKYIEVLIKFWKYFQAIVEGRISPATTANSVEKNIRHSLDGTEWTIELGLNESETVDDPSDSEPTSARMIESSEKPAEDSESQIPSFPHLKLISPSSARSMVDHLFLVLSDYFSAACVQAYMASARHMLSTLSAAPTPRYRATNISFDHMVSLNLVHQSLYTLPDYAIFEQHGGLELLLQTIHSCIPGIPQSQTYTDIATAGLKMIWVFTSLQVAAESMLSLRIRLPESHSGSDDGLSRQLAARMQELLRPENMPVGDIPIIHGLGAGGWMGQMGARGDEDDEDEMVQVVEARNTPQDGSYLDRLDLTNIRLEPVNQRVALERASSRVRSNSVTSNPATGETANGPSTVPNGDAAPSAAPPAPTGTMDEDEAAVPVTPRTSDDPTEATTEAATEAATETTEVTESKKARSPMWILLHLVRRVAITCPTVCLYVLHIFSNYLHSVSCAQCAAKERAHVVARMAVSDIRNFNGLSELVSLLKFHEVTLSSTQLAQQSAASIPTLTDWNIIRCHAMSVLNRMSQLEDAVKQILSKKLQSTLPEMLRAPVPPGLEKSFSQFKDEAYAFLATTSAAVNFKKDDTMTTSASTLSKLERNSIIANTPITYSKQELLHLIYLHFQANGLSKAAAALADDANLSPEEIRPMPPPIAPPSTLPKPRIRRGSMLGATPASAFHGHSMLHPDAPSSQNGFLPTEGNSQISLETIVKQYLYEQHKHCKHPVQVLPDLSLHSRHSCPDPVRHRMNPTGHASMNLGHRMMAHSWEHRPMRSSIWSKFKYSKHAPRRKFSDGGLLTSVTFVDNQTIYFGSGDGLVVRYNAKSVNYDDEWEVRDGPVDIKISLPSSRVLTMCESSSSILSAPEDMKIWNLGNMTHQLGSLPYVTANFSNTGVEVLGTHANGSISLWDVGSNTIVRPFHESIHSSEDEPRGGTKLLQAGSFSPDDRLVLHNSTLWDVRRSAPIHNFDRFASSSGSQIFAPSGLEVITNTEVWDSRTFKLFKTVPSLQRAQLTFSHAGDVLYCGSRSKVEVLDASNYDYISQIVLESEFDSLSINPDDTQVAVLETSTERWEGASTWRIWDIGTSRLDDESDSESDDDADSGIAEFDAAGGDLDDDDDDLDGMDDDDDEDMDDDDDEEDDEDMDLDDDDDEGYHFAHEDDYAALGLDEEDFAEIDDFDPEGDGESDFEDDFDEDIDGITGADADAEAGDDESLIDVGEDVEQLDDETIAAILAAEGMDSESGDISFDDTSEGDEEMLRRGLMRITRNTSGAGGRRPGGASSVFMELPSDEEKATRMLETGSVGEDQSESQGSMMAFDDDGNEEHSTSSAPVIEEPSGDESVSMESEEAPRRATVAKRTANRRQTEAPRRGRRPRFSMRDLSEMLGMTGKRTGKSTSAATQDPDDESTEEGPPTKKRSKKKD